MLIFYQDFGGLFSFILSRLNFQSEHHPSNLSLI
jgi:hypothetical protein